MTTTREQSSITAAAVPDKLLTASGRRLATGPRTTVEQFRREQADRAIARIEECFRRGLAIPDLR